MAEEWYWCLKHQRPEHEPDVPADERLGPYPTEEAARNWKLVNEAREETWKAQDEAWEGDPGEAE
ncbi:MAG: hypothetical protein JWN46_2811 [Acidimicrobiales bacterium]|nr:hypothetical protein [Acidimicrobiales bacterium]